MRSGRHHQSYTMGVKCSQQLWSIATVGRGSHVHVDGSDAEGHGRRSEIEGHAVDALSTSGGGRWTGVIIIKQRQRMVDGQGGGGFEGRSNTLEETECLFVECRAYRPIDPEGIGVETSHQPRREENNGLSAERRHKGEEYEEKRMRRGDWRR